MVFAIAAVPCETFGSTGLAIKKASPFPLTMVIGLANGYHGYLPPPDQFPLGNFFGHVDTCPTLRLRQQRGQLRVRAADDVGQDQFAAEAFDRLLAGGDGGLHGGHVAADHDR